MYYIIFYMSLENNIIKNCLSIWELEAKNTLNEELYLSYYENECLLSLKQHSAYILDKEKEKFDFIEKLVYDLSKFHLRNINIDVDKSDIVVEFWFKTSGSYDRIMHTDGDDNAISMGKLCPVPLMSQLLYFNDNNNPTLVTNIDEESYKYKQFTDENKNLFLVFPKKMRNIIFNGGYFHSEINIFNEIDNNTDLRNVLVVDIWHNYNPIGLPLYNSKKYKSHTYHINEESNYLFKKNSIVKHIPLDDSILNNNFFSEILYNRNNNVYNFLSKILNKQYIYEGLYIINNINTNNKIQNEDPFKKLNINCNKYIDWIEYIAILPNVIDDIVINDITSQFKMYGELNNKSELFLYIMNNISVNIIYKNITKHYKLDNTFKIDVEKIELSCELSTDNNTTIIASLFLKDDIIHNELSNEEIEIKKGTLIFQNNNYINKNFNNQLIIEFFINVENI